ncbi:A-kinase-interacting protein 1, partial [Lemmus lemmus]
PSGQDLEQSPRRDSSQFEPGPRAPRARPRPPPRPAHLAPRLARQQARKRDRGNAGVSGEALRACAWRSRSGVGPHPGPGRRKYTGLGSSLPVPSLECAGDMEYCLAAAALNGVDRRSLQRSARLGREVLERAKRRAVDWHSPERSIGSVGVLYRPGSYQERWSVPGPQRLLGEREERRPTLSASFRTMAEFMDYTSSQCGKYYSCVPEEGGTTHVYRYHRRQPPEVHAHSDLRHGHRNGRVETSIGPGSSYQTSERSREKPWPAEDISKDLYIEVYPGTYSVTVGSSPLTKKTHVVVVDSGQSVDLVFPI